MQYIKYKVAQRVMEQNLIDYETKYAALQSKYPNSYDEMVFRELHHEYIKQRDEIQPVGYSESLFKGIYPVG